MKAVSPNLEYVDALFMIVSAISGTGLYSIEMRYISDAGAVVLYIWILMGGICLLLLPPMIHRKWAYHRIRPQLERFLATDGKTNHPLAMDLVELIARRELKDRAIGMVIIAVFIHNLLWIVGGEHEHARAWKNLREEHAAWAVSHG